MVGDLLEVDSGGATRAAACGGGGGARHAAGATHIGLVGAPLDVLDRVCVGRFCLVADDPRAGWWVRSQGRASVQGAMQLA